MNVNFFLMYGQVWLGVLVNVRRTSRSAHWLSSCIGQQGQQYNHQGSQRSNSCSLKSQVFQKDNDVFYGQLMQHTGHAAPDRVIQRGRWPAAIPLLSACLKCGPGRFGLYTLESPKSTLPIVVIPHVFSPAAPAASRPPTPR